MPPQFVASGVRYQGGIYNQPFTAGFTFADVDARMDEATVVLLNAGFLIPKLAAISLAMLAMLGADRALSVAELRRMLAGLVAYVDVRGLPTTEPLDFESPGALEALLDPLVANGVLDRLARHLRPEEFEAAG